MSKHKSMIAAMREELDLDAQALANINAGLMVGGHRAVDTRYKDLGERAARLAVLTGEDEKCILWDQQKIIDQA